LRQQGARFLALVTIRNKLATGQRSEMAESLVDALEGSLRLFEKHRVLILGQLLRQLSELSPGARRCSRPTPAYGSPDITAFGAI
jgi:hypothetical protein